MVKTQLDMRTVVKNKNNFQKIRNIWTSATTAQIQNGYKYIYVTIYTTETKV